MKKTLILTAVLFAAVMVSAQTSPKAGEDLQLYGLEMVETLSDDGMEIIKCPFRWFAGIGESNNKQIAIEIAQREAQVTVSRIIRNEVIDQAARLGIDINGRVCQALVSSWSQYSHSILVGCEPLGKAEVQYNCNTGIYRVKAKIGIRGDRFRKMMNECMERTPEGLTSAEIQQFIQINQTVISIMVSK